MTIGDPTRWHACSEARAGVARHLARFMDERKFGQGGGRVEAGQAGSHQQLFPSGILKRMVCGLLIDGSTLLAAVLRSVACGEGAVGTDRKREVGCVVVRCFGNGLAADLLGGGRVFASWRCAVRVVLWVLALGSPRWWVMGAKHCAACSVLAGMSHPSPKGVRSEWKSS